MPFWKANKILISFIDITIEKDNDRIFLITYIILMEG